MKVIELGKWRKALCMENTPIPSIALSTSADSSGGCGPAVGRHVVGDNGAVTAALGDDGLGRIVGRVCRHSGRKLSVCDLCLM